MPSPSPGPRAPPPAPHSALLTLSSRLTFTLVHARALAHRWHWATVGPSRGCIPERVWSRQALALPSRRRAPAGTSTRDTHTHTQTHTCTLHARTGSCGTIEESDRFMPSLYLYLSLAPSLPRSTPAPPFSVSLSLCLSAFQSLCLSLSLCLSHTPAWGHEARSF